MNGYRMIFKIQHEVKKQGAKAYITEVIFCVNKRGMRDTQLDALTYMGKVFSERTHKILTILVASGEMNQMAGDRDETFHYIISELLNLEPCVYITHSKTINF